MHPPIYSPMYIVFQTDYALITVCEMYFFYQLILVLLTVGNSENDISLNFILSK